MTPLRTCRVCLVEKPLAAFQQHRPGKYRRLCRNCRSKQDRAGNYRRKLWPQYGLTEEEYLALVEKHNGHCACCDKKTALVIDHDHATGEVRGLLCRNCNLGIGILGDTVQDAKNAYDYLRSVAPSW